MQNSFIPELRDILAPLNTVKNIIVFFEKFATSKLNGLMIFAKHELGFNFYEDETSFEKIKGCKNYPEDFYYEIFV
ncbi:MAG: hypothetical protein ACSHWV_10315, partial [Cellulophaga fucicola]